MITHEIQSDIEAIEKDAALYEQIYFDRRVETIDYIEFNIIDRIEGLFQTIHPPDELLLLKQYAERVKHQLEAIDSALFEQIRAGIRMGHCTGMAFKNLVDAYAGRDSGGRLQQDQPGYDNLDVFINGLLLFQPAPIETQAREPEMVYYQQTPARIIFELVERAHLTGADAFCDLGSGLGHVPILVNLLSGAKSKGIEFEPAYCDYARICAANLNLSGVDFINMDARTADYSEGLVFFMYTPFEGGMLQEVLEKLRFESHRRKITLFTYGPCTPHVSRQRWLSCVDQHDDHIYKLAMFRSV